MKKQKVLGISLFCALSIAAHAQNGISYKIVDTSQAKCFDNEREIHTPKQGDSFYGQDAQHKGRSASYTANGDGTVTDNVTGLVWQQGYEVMSYKEALEAIEEFKLAGFTDWRIPSIKEAYSLIQFSGCDVSPQLSSSDEDPGIPFLETSVFDFEYGANGGRAIDSQMLTSTLYVGSTERETLLFGVNFADGRIKGYGLGLGGQDKKFMVRFVRGEEYGTNDFVNNADGTITDRATTLMWSRDDSKRAMNWQEALAYAQEMNEQNYLGYSDWRVPNAKELQSIVDYTRSPLSTQSPAIDAQFNVSSIVDESGADDYPFYWTSTTHENSGSAQGSAAVYVAFGRSLGNMSNSQGMQMMPPMQNRGDRKPPEGDRPHNVQPQMPRSRGSNTPNWIDVHGAGSQRSDPKEGDASVYANGHGPQGDAIRIDNYVRLVRDL